MLKKNKKKTKRIIRAHYENVTMQGHALCLVVIPENHFVF